MNDHITILCDYNYIYYAVALVYSLKNTSCRQFTIDFLCLDDKTYDVMQKIDYKINCYKESEIITNTRLLWIKKNEPTYYFYTLASYFSNHIMKTTNCDSVMYIDSDILFHKDISILYNAFGSKDVGIFRHRFNNYPIMMGAGDFNVGVVYFKNSVKGREVLEWWTDAVVYQKYSEKGLDTCGDQKYLNEFPNLCNETELFVDGNIGHGAPWNWLDYQLGDVDKYSITYNGNTQELVFTHFSKFFYDFSNDSYNEIWPGYYPLTDNGKVFMNYPALKRLHNEYFEHLKNANRIITNITQNVKIAACIMVTENNYFLKQCIEQLYPLVEQIIIVVGTINNLQQTNMDKIHEVINNYKDNDIKVKIIDGPFANDVDKFNSYIPYIRKDIDYLWHLEPTEIYTINNILKIKEILYTQKPTSIGIKNFTFYGGFEYFLTGTEQQNDKFIRLFKFIEGSVWKMDNKPIIQYPSYIQTKHISSDELYNLYKINMHRYSYVFPSQIKQIIDDENVLDNSNVIPNYMTNIYFSWIHGNDDAKRAIEKIFSGLHMFKSECQGKWYTQLYEQKHPEAICKDLFILKKEFNKEYGELLLEEWKNPHIPFKHLESMIDKLNNKNEYPSHWVNFLYSLNYIDSLYLKKIYDIKCNTGVIYKLLQNNNYDLSYTGFDFSESMINVAKQQWKSDKFYVNDLHSLSELGENDIIYDDGLLNIVFNSETYLENILKLQAEYVILNRVAIHEKHEIIKYTAYDLIKCIEYCYEETQLLDIIQKNNYIVKHKKDNLFLLQNMKHIMEHQWESPILSYKQLILNKTQLVGNYPAHWYNLLKSLQCIENITSKEFNDFGCAVGSTYKLLKDNNYNLNYKGYDFSEMMILTAKKEWRYPNFFIADFKKMKPGSCNDIIYMDGVLDILFDAVKCLDSILKLNVQYVILNRVVLGKENIKKFIAYEYFEMIEYTFDKVEFYNILEINNYKIKFTTDNLFLLEKV